MMTSLACELEEDIPLLFLALLFSFNPLSTAFCVTAVSFFGRFCVVVVAAVV